jgi:hypothetical protein
MSVEAQENLPGDLQMTSLWLGDVAVQIPVWVTREHSEERVLPYNFEGEKKTLLIGACMGMGKTHQVREYLASHPDLTRVLMITSDPQQSHSTCSALAELKWDDGTCGVTNALEHEGVELARFDKLVIQYTALHRLQTSQWTVEMYDLVIVDDVRSVLSVAQGDVVDSVPLVFNYGLFQSLVTHGQSIFLGANIEADGAVWQWASEIMPPGQILFHRYTHKADQRELILVSEQEWRRMLCDNLASGGKVGVSCRSKTVMNDVLGMEEVTNHSTLKYDSDSDQHELVKMKNIDSYLQGVDLLAFTDKMATGVDIQEAFHTIYAHCDEVTGPTPRDMLQMIGRFRHVTSGQVVCCLPEMLDPTLCVTYESEHALIGRRGDAGANASEFLVVNGMEKTESGNFRFRRHPLHALTAHGRVEKYACFASKFVQQATRKGWRVTMCVANEEAPIALLTSTQSCS